MENLQFSLEETESDQIIHSRLSVDINPYLYDNSHNSCSTNTTWEHYYKLKRFRPNEFLWTDWKYGYITKYLKANLDIDDLNKTLQSMQEEQQKEDSKSIKQAIIDKTDSSQQKLPGTW